MCIYLFDFTFISRLLKTAVFDALIIQHKPGLVPIKSFEAIGTGPTKQKNCVVISIQTKHISNQGGQTVYPFAEISFTANEIDFHIIYIWKHFDHDTKDSCSNF